MYQAIMLRSKTDHRVSIIITHDMDLTAEGLRDVSAGLMGEMGGALAYACGRRDTLEEARAHVEETFKGATELKTADAGPSVDCLYLYESRPASLRHV